jgi:hypothetical protein
MGGFVTGIVLVKILSGCQTGLTGRMRERPKNLTSAPGCVFKILRSPHRRTIAIFQKRRS